MKISPSLPLFSSRRVQPERSAVRFSKKQDAESSQKKKTRWYNLYYPVLMFTTIGLGTASFDICSTPVYKESRAFQKDAESVSNNLKSLQKLALPEKEVELAEQKAIKTLFQDQAKRIASYTSNQEVEQSLVEQLAKSDFTKEEKEFTRALVEKAKEDKLTYDDFAGWLDQTMASRLSPETLTAFKEDSKAFYDKMSRVNRFQSGITLALCLLTTLILADACLELKRAKSDLKKFQSDLKKFQNEA